MQARGCYAGLDGVDAWPEARDARTYAGPHPVVAHPPCQRWSKLAAQVEARGGPARRDDGGCFAAALASVRRCGGVLEHPAESDAWVAYDLTRPPKSGGWGSAGPCGGWTCRVDQGAYGHFARKATWLYVVVSDPRLLPDLIAHASGDFALAAPPGATPERVRQLQRRGRVGQASKRLRDGTPPAFRDLLLDIARASRRLLGQL